MKLKYVGRARVGAAHGFEYEDVATGRKYQLLRRVRGPDRWATYEAFSDRGVRVQFYAEGVRWTVAVERFLGALGASLVRVPILVPVRGHPS